MSENLEKIQVLAVDDDHQNLDLLAMVLEKNNYLVEKAYDGKKAIALAQKIKPDIIVMDVMMPELNGFEACARLKQQKETQNIPIIFITGLSNTKNKVQGFKSGGVDYVTKPFQFEEVLARIHAHAMLRKQQQKLEQQNEQILALAEKLEKISRTDPLTKLSNRRDFMEKLNQEQARCDRQGSPFCLVLGDIDHFKKFNDNYGHDCGDFVLVSIAETLRQAIRKEDFPARWGGEEFILLLPETEKANGKKIAERIRETIAESTYNHKDRVLKVTMTFGLSEYQSGESIAQSIKQADIALYKGKQKGRNCVIG